MVAFELNGDARAYPLQILIWHEIVDDVVGSTPVVITFCPLCNTAIAYQGQRRTSSTSRTAGAGDALHGLPDTGKQVDHHLHEQYFIPYGNRHTTYAGFMRRYMHEHGAQREDFGRIAINSRTNAMRNEHATLREPLTMDDYLAGRMVRDPMCVYDMDYAVDGGDALVLTTAERARDLVENPSYSSATSMSCTPRSVLAKSDGAAIVWPTVSMFA